MTRTDRDQALVEVFLDGFPFVEGIQADAGTQLTRDPPTRLGVVQRIDRRLAQSDVRSLVGNGQEVVVALQVGGLGQDNIRPGNVLLGKHIDGDNELECFERLERLLRIRYRIQQIYAVDHEGLDGIRIARDHRVDQFLHCRRPPHEAFAHAVGPGFPGRSQRQLCSLFTRLGRAPARATGDRVGRVGIVLQIDALVEIHPTFPAVSAEKGVDEVSSPHPLTVVAVPDRVPAGMTAARGRLAAIT
jgi:hypothetical protein